MKRMIAFFLCVLLLTGCAATYDGPTETKQALTEYEIRHYSPFFDDSEVDVNRSVYAYDIYGNRVRELEYDNGELDQETRTKFDDQGNEVSQTVIDHTGWIPLIERRTKRTYDEQGRCLSYANYNMWGIKKGETTYTYDDEANTMTWSNGIGDSTIYYYDENGLLLRDVSNDGYETVYQYDERGNRIGWTSTKDGKLFSRYEAAYDELDRQIWGIHYDENGAVTSRVTYTYDDEAHTRTISRADGGTRIEYSDSEGRIHLIEDYNEDSEMSMVQQYFYRGILVPASGEE